MPKTPPKSATPAPQFVHLHLHSQYSLLDGANRLDKLVDRVKELGMDAVAVTDHGNLFGAVDFYTKAKAAGVKPILGIEAYVAPDTQGRTSDRTSREHTGISDGGFHLVLLAENDTGWHNLIKLSSDSYVNGFYYKPRMDKTTLAQWSDGLIAINGHLGSSLAHYMTRYVNTQDESHFTAALEEAKWHAEVFKPNADGQPRFFVELQRHDTPEQDAINEPMARLAKELDLPLVCDNDAHFLEADDWGPHDTLCCISMAKLKSDTNRLHYPKELYVKSPAQMAELFADHPEALANTVRIAERCNVEIDLSASHAPVVQVAVGDRLEQARAEQDTAAKTAQAFKSDHPTGSTEWFKDFCSQFQILPFEEGTDAGG